ncbi:MAG: glucokinase, partial [Pseudomonadota bacterium]|nr:glucokinase [Pseudomonadota bacterium]
MRQIVTADVGGTHARFALASIDAGGVVALDRLLTLRTAEHATFQLAWEAFGRHVGTPLPREIAIALAGPVGSDILKLTNNPWMIQPDQIGAQLSVDRHMIVNDFGAVAHAVAGLDESFFRHVCGEDRPLPADGVTTVIGPGTGLGVAALVRRPNFSDVIETEGGHIDYAPLDPLEDQILAHLRKSFSRVSVERLVSGAGLVNIYGALAAIEHRAVVHRDDKALWAAALGGSDRLATAALERFCLIFGAVAGDTALAHGAHAVVIAGGLGLRLSD